MQTLSQAIKKNIYNRMLLSVGLLMLIHLISIVFYVYWFSVQSKKQLDDISSDLTPYIVSQEIIGNRYAIDLKFEELEKSHHIKIKWFKYDVKSTSQFKFVNFLKWKYIVPVRAIDEKYYGYYEIEGSIKNDQWIIIGLISQFLFLTLFILIIFFILYPIANHIPKKIFVEPINNLINFLSKDNEKETGLLVAPYEILVLRDKFIEILERQNEVLKKKEMLRIAEHVAHDIRSPLAAIGMVLPDIQFMHENKRKILKNAVQRINDIANNLLEKSRQHSNHDYVANSNACEELVFSMLDGLVSEKRYEYLSKDLKIEFYVLGKAYFCFSLINQCVFKRIISNLINNSIEATGYTGIIVITLKCNESSVEIIIEDNGCGIPVDVLPKVMSYGYTYNKKNGAGIGLASAKQYIEEVGGTISIDSLIKKGTSVTIKLPMIASPAWFCNTINIHDVTHIIILDDEELIHKLWEEKLSAFPGINLTHYYTSDELYKHVTIYGQSVIYLIDYELLGDALNGVEIIERLNIHQNARLVTGSYEDQVIRDKCNKLNLKIIPKSIVAYINLEQL